MANKWWFEAGFWPELAKRFRDDLINAGWKKAGLMIPSNMDHPVNQIKLPSSPSNIPVLPQ
jgi:hypothetical protein